MSSKSHYLTISALNMHLNTHILTSSALNMHLNGDKCGLNIIFTKFCTDPAFKWTLLWSKSHILTSSALNMHLNGHKSGLYLVF